MQCLLTEDETTEGGHPPAVIKHRRPGSKHPAYGMPASEWPIMLQRVLEQKEPLLTVAAGYGVSHETIRRVIRATTKVHLQPGCWATEVTCVSRLRMTPDGYLGNAGPRVA